MIKDLQTEIATLTDQAAKQECNYQETCLHDKMNQMVKIRTEIEMIRSSLRKKYDDLQLINDEINTLKIIHPE